MDYDEALEAAYKKAGHNAYFGEGFKAGVEYGRACAWKESPRNHIPLSIKPNLHGHALETWGLGIDKLDFEKFKQPDISSKLTEFVREITRSLNQQLDGIFLYLLVELDLSEDKEIQQRMFVTNFSKDTFGGDKEADTYFIFVDKELVCVVERYGYSKPIVDWCSHNKWDSTQPLLQSAYQLMHEHFNTIEKKISDSCML